MPIDTCPVCGGSIEAHCSVIATYDIDNNKEGKQDWTRVDIDDDSSEPEFFICVSCRTKYYEGNFEIDDEGYLSSLIPPENCFSNTGN